MELAYSDEPLAAVEVPDGWSPACLLTLPMS